LGRSVSTISRELKRNSKTSKRWKGGYDPQRAQQLTQPRHARGRAHKLELHPDLRKEVFDRFYWRTWSFKKLFIACCRGKSTAGEGV
jgi:IS30 family transposase